MKRVSISRLELPNMSPTPLLPQSVSAKSASKTSYGFPTTLITPVLTPGRRRLHTAFAALAALFIVSLYFVTAPLLSLPNATPSSSSSDWSRFKSQHNATKHGQNSWSLAHSHRKPITLDTDAELAAVTNFIASLASNAIPPTVDPSKPIDPELVLGFDIRSPRALEDLQELRVDVWEKNPVIIFSEVCGFP